MNDESKPQGADVWEKLILATAGTEYARAGALMHGFALVDQALKTIVGDGTFRQRLNRGSDRKLLQNQTVLEEAYEHRIQFSHHGVIPGARDALDSLLVLTRTDYEIHGDSWVGRRDSVWLGGLQTTVLRSIEVSKQPIHRRPTAWENDLVLVRSFGNSEDELGRCAALVLAACYFEQILLELNGTVHTDYAYKPTDYAWIAGKLKLDPNGRSPRTFDELTPMHRMWFAAGRKWLTEDASEALARAIDARNAFAHDGEISPQDRALAHIEAFASNIPSLANRIKAEHLEREIEAQLDLLDKNPTATEIRRASSSLEPKIRRKAVVLGARCLEQAVDQLATNSNHNPRTLPLRQKFTHEFVGPLRTEVRLFTGGISDAIFAYEVAIRGESAPSLEEAVRHVEVFFTIEARAKQEYLARTERLRVAEQALHKYEDVLYEQNKWYLERHKALKLLANDESSRALCDALIKANARERDGILHLYPELKPRVESIDSAVRRELINSLISKNLSVPPALLNDGYSRHGNGPSVSLGLPIGAIAIVFFAVLLLMASKPDKKIDSSTGGDSDEKVDPPNACATSASFQAFAPKRARIVSEGYSLVVLECPADRARTVYNVRPGTAVDVIGQTADSQWVKIRLLPEGGSAEGWIKKVDIQSN